MPFVFKFVHVSPRDQAIVIGCNISGTMAELKETISGLDERRSAERQPTSTAATARQVWECWSCRVDGAAQRSSKQSSPRNPRYSKIQNDSSPAKVKR